MDTAEIIFWIATSFSILVWVFTILKYNTGKSDIKKYEECIPIQPIPEKPIPAPPIPEEPKEEKPKCKGVVVERYKCSKYTSDNVYFPNADSYVANVNGEFTDVMFYTDGVITTKAKFRTSDIKAIY